MCKAMAPFHSIRLLNQHRVLIIHAVTTEEKEGGEKVSTFCLTF